MVGGEGVAEVERFGLGVGRHNADGVKHRVALNRAVMAPFGRKITHVMEGDGDFPWLFGRHPVLGPSCKPERQRALRQRVMDVAGDIEIVQVTGASFDLNLYMPEYKTVEFHRARLSLLKGHLEPQSHKQRADDFAFPATQL